MSAASWNRNVPVQQWMGKFIRWMHTEMERKKKGPSPLDERPACLVTREMKRDYYTPSLTLITHAWYRSLCP